MNKHTSFANSISSKLKNINYVEYTEEEYIQIANSTATSYSDELTYEVGDFVVYKDNTYECIQRITTGESFTLSKWKYLCPYVNPDYPETGISTAVFDISALYQYIDEKTAAAEETAEGASQVANEANTTANEANAKATDVETRANNGEFNGRDGINATSLKISSSRGNIFKNNSTNTQLSVRVFNGNDIIINQTDLMNVFGANAYLQWYGQSVNESSFTPISRSDSRIGNNGFTFNLAPSDVETKLTLSCELIV